MNSNYAYISEQQKNAVESIGKYKLVQGCAGSHKTSTLIYCALDYIEKNQNSENGNTVLFLTLVSSVTFELKERMEKMIQTVIKKQGSSNHYLGEYCGGKICISNFDAWVHLMLPNASKIGNQYKRKTNTLLELSMNERMEIKIKNSKFNASLIVIDEIQDFNMQQISIIKNIIRNNPSVNLYVAGDLMQTIFKPDTYNFNMSRHAIYSIKELNPLYFDMNLCLRCPQAHVTFANHLFRRYISKIWIS